MKLIFDREGCSRCCGTGQYSYCQRYGKTCFKCGGSGKQLTKAGKRAAAAWAAYLEAHRTVAFASVQVGDVVLLETAFGSNKKRAVKILESAPDRLNSGMHSLRYNVRDRLGNVTGYGYSAGVDSRVTLPVRNEDIAGFAAEWLENKRIKVKGVTVVDDTPAPDSAPAENSSESTVDN